MSLYLIFSIITAFLALAFALLHLLASLTEVKKRESHSRKYISPHRKWPCDLLSHPLLPFADCRTISLADWLWVDLLRSLLEWQAQRKLQSSPPCHSIRNRSDSYHFVSPHIRKEAGTKVLAS